MNELNNTYIDFSAPEMDWTNAREPQHYENNSEQALEIYSAEFYDSQAGNRMLKVKFKSANDPAGFVIITEFLSMPTADDDDEKREKKLLGLKRFHDALNMRPQAVNLVDPLNNVYTGKQLRALITLEDNEQYGLQNRIRRYIKSA